MLEVISRAESGLPVPTTATIESGRAHSLVLHHWGNFNNPTNSARARELRRLHLQRISSIGEAYNWMVGHDAPEKAWELRGRGHRPGSQRNIGGFDNNAGTRSIVVNGDYRHPGDPEGPIARDLIDTIAQLVVREHLAGDMPAQFTHGHGNYIRPDGNGCCQSTSCPGTRLMDAIPAINRRITQLLEDEMVDRNTAVDPNPALADNVEKMRDAGVFSEHTQPGGVTFNDELATFLVRAGLRPKKGARTWTKAEIAAIAAGAAVAGASADQVIAQIARILGG